MADGLSRLCIGQGVTGRQVQRFAVERNRTFQHIVENQRHFFVEFEDPMAVGIGKYPVFFHAAL